MKRFLALGTLFALIVLTSACRSTYYSAWEKLGKYKRDLLRDNVTEVRKDQAAAVEQFKDALTRLRELYRVDGGDLEKLYDRLKADLDRSNTRATAVSARIQKVEQVASDLFAEWADEAKTLTNPRLRQDSERKLRETRDKYDGLHSAMKRAEDSMKPVLTQFREQVTYLKHNLNAQAIGALRGEVVDIEKEVQQLIQNMNTSIAEAESFLRTMP